MIFITHVSVVIKYIARPAILVDEYDTTAKPLAIEFPVLKVGIDDVADV